MIAALAWPAVVVLALVFMREAVGDWITAQAAKAEHLAQMKALQEDMAWFKDTLKTAKSVDALSVAFRSKKP